jgi:hypothetical protein
MGKLEIGEKYLSVQILGSVRCAAFKNKDKKKPSEPDYKGDGIAIWVQTKKAPIQPKVSQEDLI